jgi:hypothetical protein
MRRVPTGRRAVPTSGWQTESGWSLLVRVLGLHGQIVALPELFRRKTAVMGIDSHCGCIAGYYPENSRHGEAPTTHWGDLY